MKKSCSGKESKAVRYEGTKVVLNVSKKNTKNLADEQISKTNLESGTENEHIDLFEKKTVVKTINVSWSPHGNEKLQRTR